MKWLALFTLCITSQLASAQVWISPNAVWHYNFAEYSGTSIEGFYRYWYDHDTIIDGKNCQAINCKSYEFLTWPSVEFYDSSAIWTNYTYVSNDTVYYRNNDEFFVLFDFGASIGDTWIISTTNNGWGDCNDTSRVEVADTGSVILNGQSFRTITLEPVAGSSFAMSGVYNEKFGMIGTDTPWHLFPRADVCDSMTIVEWYYLTFKCFEDDSFSLYNPSGNDCEYLLTHLDAGYQEQHLFTIYPNPTADMIHIDSPENGVLQIISLSGQLVASFEVNISDDISLSCLNSGTYIAQFTSVSGNISREIIVKY